MEAERVAEREGEGESPEEREVGLIDGIVDGSVDRVERVDDGPRLRIIHGLWNVLDRRRIT
jgi:hypothetical protein